MLEISVCGEMAGHPLWSLLLVGLGVGRLSMNAAAIPAVKEALSAARHDELCCEARALLELDGPSEVREAWTRFVT